ncbi:hypothetical protein ASG25_21490 [Rhizobium sp. Leaf384]|nr:hypothetical protein ASG25_21490 [Rhizobium sp. Leaf384]
MERSMNTYNPVTTRHVAAEMATAQREAGRSLTKNELMSELGLTEEQVTTHANEAARLFANSERRAA